MAASVIDLRSDTVTQPSEEMRRAMAGAELGDDVFGEDPTVNRLEARAAELMGKEAALLVPSGTMGNLVGLLVNARAGQEVILEAESHVFFYEGAGSAIVGGIQLRPLPGRRGVLSPEQIQGALRPRSDVHQPPTAAVAFENTHNRHGGAVWPLEALRAASAAARERGLAVHLDGARIFNAALATGATAHVLADCADTVSFCLSKGLACPVGSVLTGSAEESVMPVIYHSASKTSRTASSKDSTCSRMSRAARAPSPRTTASRATRGTRRGSRGCSCGSSREARSGWTA